jgi:hypothetical protein
VIKIGGTSIVCWALVTNILMEASISYVWGTLSALQLVAYITFINALVPANAQLFFETIIELSEFDVIPTDWIFDLVFPNLDETKAEMHS